MSMTFEEAGLPTPKFKVGQTVYWARVERFDESESCPDCLGSGKWDVTTPAGESLQIQCPRCNRSYGAPSYRVTRFKALAVPYTIGSMSVDMSSHPSWGAPIKYSTGGNSCSYVHEDVLFAEEAEAMAVATAKAAEDEAQHLKHNPIERLRRELTSLTFVAASIKDAEDKERKARGRADALVEKLHDLPNELISVRREDISYLSEATLKQIANIVLEYCDEQPIEDE